MACRDERADGAGRGSGHGRADCGGDGRSGHVPRREHARGARRGGFPARWRGRVPGAVVNALLGMVQIDAAMADSAKLDGEARHTAWEQQLMAAGAGLQEDPAPIGSGER
ncbi:DUF6245 family protein [Streptomyces sp. NPDC048448]|uniref:DUF6245 family protein n=1 Tax=Streptomyces sp. NPDC048448 TaxID=3365554 RepID=UPI0037195E26